MPAQHSQKVKLERETTPPGTYVAVGELTEIAGPDGSAVVLDVTNLESDVVTKLSGLPDAGSYSVTMNQDLGDAQQSAMRTEWSDATVASHNYRVSYPDPANLSTTLLTRTFAAKVQSWNITATQNTQITVAASLLVLATIADT